MTSPPPATTPWVPLWNLNGAAGMQYRGAYVGATQYADGDIVVYQGVSYLCVRPTTNPPGAWSVPPSGVWQTWTPILTQGVAVTFTVARAKYVVFGKTVHLDCALGITGAGTSGSAVTVGGLPLAVAATQALGGTFWIGASTAPPNIVGMVSAVSGTQVQFIGGGQYNNYVGSTPAFGFVNGNSLQMWVTYEAA